LPVVTSLVLAAQDRIPVRVGVYGNAPIVSAAPGVPPEGIAIDVLRQVAEREGWQLTYVPDTFDRLLARLDQGDIDLLAGIAYSDERAKRFQFTEQSLIGNWDGVPPGRGDIDSPSDRAARRADARRTTARR
jgi:ABC-type amino acid transport substrate-binding protein